MWAALYLDGRHVAHERLRVLALLRVSLRHGQQLPRRRQAIGLGRPRHWDTLEAIPPRSKWKSDNGKF